MATRTVIESDISGKPGASPVSFSLGPDAYEIDLIEDEHRDLEQALAPYVEKARKKTGCPAEEPTGRFVPETTKAQRHVIRQWAKENGFEIEDRGQIPKKIFFAYKKAHGGEIPEITEEDLV